MKFITMTKEASQTFFVSEFIPMIPTSKMNLPMKRYDLAGHLLFNDGDESRSEEYCCMINSMENYYYQ